VGERFDVVVVGSGAGGLSAAVAAAHGGARVLVVEKSATCGGATAWSGGWMWTPRHRFAREAGVVEDVEAPRTYLRNRLGRNFDEAKVDAFLAGAPDMVDFFEVLRSKQAREPSKVEQFFSSHPIPSDRAARIRNEMKLLTVRPANPVGGFRQARATLVAMPAARSMAQIAQNPAPQPRTYPETGMGQLGVEAPATTFQTFEQRNRFFRIDYPANWRVYEASGLGATIAPEGGFVDTGASERDLVYGVVINHYDPFQNDDDTSADGRFSFLGSPGEPTGVNRTSLAAATNDLVGQIVRTNPSLKLVPDSQRTDSIDGASALSLTLSGRSRVTGTEERVTVFTRELPDDHVIYALFIAPGADYAALRATFNRMISSLRVNDDASHR